MILRSSGGGGSRPSNLMDLRMPVSDLGWFLDRRLVQTDRRGGANGSGAFERAVETALQDAWVGIRDGLLCVQHQGVRPDRPPGLQIR